MDGNKATTQSAVHRGKGIVKRAIAVFRRREFFPPASSVLIAYKLR